MTIYDFTDKSWHKLKTVKARAQALTIFSQPGPSLLSQALLGREETFTEYLFLSDMLASSTSETTIDQALLFFAFLLTIDEETAQELAKEITK